MKRMSAVLCVAMLAACATVPPEEPKEWSAVAAANPGFGGAAANAVARSGAGATSVAVAYREAQGMSGTVRPWHLHYGTCGNDQGVVGDMSLYQPLRPQSDGTATVTANIPMALAPDKSYFINIHKSPQETNTIVACGQLSQGIAPPMISSGSAPSQPGGEARMIHVALNEYRIDLGDTLPAGRVKFHVMNSGSLPHSFGVRSSSAAGAPGASTDAYDRSLASPLQPGQMGTLEVDLEPGSYEAYCPVGDHASSHGMTKTFMVK